MNHTQSIYIHFFGGLWWCCCHRSRCCCLSFAIKFNMCSNFNWAPSTFTGLFIRCTFIVYCELAHLRMWYKYWISRINWYLCVHKSIWEFVHVRWRWNSTRTRHHHHETKKFNIQIISAFKCKPRHNTLSLSRVSAVSKCVLIWWFDKISSHTNLYVCQEKTSKQANTHAHTNFQILSSREMTVREREREKQEEKKNWMTDDSKEFNS